MSGGVSHKREGLSNRHGVLGVRGEEILSNGELSVVSGQLSVAVSENHHGMKGLVTKEHGAMAEEASVSEYWTKSAHYRTPAYAQSFGAASSRPISNSEPLIVSGQWFVVSFGFVELRVARLVRWG
jgi:hypothetical protein